MRRRRHGEVPVRRYEATNHLPSPQVSAVLPANDWVAERVDENNVRSVLPLVGWLVTAEGELRPLPLSLDATWTIRPRRVTEDSRLIDATAVRLRSTTKNRQNDPWTTF
jgi:hypothetical protein